MPRTSDPTKSALETHLTDWMVKEQAALDGVKRLSKKQRAGIAERAVRLLDKAKNKGILCVLEKFGRPIALVARAEAGVPRVKKQQNLFLIYDKRHRKSARRWIQKQLSALAVDSPRFTQIGLSSGDDAIFGKVLTKGGFNTRYEILMGNTRVAFKNLMKMKQPSPNLNHLGLEIKPITSKPEVLRALRLQKRIALRSKNHGYFSHTAEQLRKDTREYLRIVAKKDGLLLGVYRGKMILGLMLAGIHTDPSRPGKIGGFSFFLDPSIQGLGITKTGYRLMLEYLLKAKVYQFVGGTSQPAIQAMGKIMKRRVRHVIYVKMEPSK